MAVRNILVRQWRGAPMGAKFAAIMSFMLFLIIFTAVIGSIALRLTLNHVESVILASTEIRTLTLEVDRELQHARQLERAFFLQWPRIGFASAVEIYGLNAQTQIQNVIKLTGVLHDKLEASAITRELQEAVVHLDFYLSAAERYAQTFAEAVLLVSELAREKTGRQTTITVLGESLVDRLETLEIPELLLLFRTSQVWQNLYLGTRQRSDMQAALNILTRFRNSLGAASNLPETTRRELLNMLQAYEYVAHQILELDRQLEEKFQEFDLQISALVPISNQLLDLSRLEMDRARESIAKTRRYTTSLLVLAVFMALALGLSSAQVMHRSITRKFAMLTSAADQLRSGDLQARAEVVSGDEIGRLAETFNTMAERISNLMHDLRQRFEMSQTRLFQGIESIDEGFALFDRHGVLAAANQNATRLLPGGESSPPSGTSFHDWLATLRDAGDFQEREPEQWFDNHLEMFSNGTGAGELGLVDGRLLKIRYSRAANSETVVLLEDITERKQMEEQRLGMERQLLHTQKLESLGVLAGGIAHDFNNLLSAMQGNMELALTMPALQEPARKRIQQALLAARRAADLTRQMLAYSGKGSFDVRPLMLNDLVQDNAHIFRTALAKNVHLVLKLAPFLPLIRADAGQVQQVIMNLITNASEAIGDHPGTMTLSTKVAYCDEACVQRSRGTEKPEPGWFVWLGVEDTGSGMSAEVQARLFDPFFSTKFTGRGLGLSAVLGIVRGHGGAIMIQSELNTGTIIEVLFPVDESELRNSTPVVADAVLSSEKMADSSKKPSLGPDLVLVVDDEEMVRELSVEALQHLGYAAVAAVDGMEGIRIFQEQKENIVCVILDLMMPNMDGVTTFAELRTIRPDIPIILCSGYSSQEAEQRFGKARPTAFLQKPFSIEALKAALHKAHPPA